MELRLPVPIFTENFVYTHVDFKKPTGSVLTKTKDVYNSSGIYLSMRTFMAGCIERIYCEEKSITDPIQVKSLLMSMPNKSVEYVMIQIIVFYYNKEDFVDGVYGCPMCGELVKAKKTEDIDTRDRMSELEVTFMEEYQNEIEITLTEPVIIPIKGEDLEITDIGIRIPTLEDHHKAYIRYGDGNDIKLQLGIYSEALTKINGQSITDSWRKPFGMKVFEEMPEIKTDTEKLSSFINAFGVDLRVTKHCPNCKEVWRPVINTSNFFGSALQSL